MASTKKGQTSEGEHASPDKYEVLCWGACTEDSPCGISYLAGGVEKRAQTGDTVDDLPASDIGAVGQEEFRSLILGVHIRKVEEVV